MNDNTILRIKVPAHLYESVKEQLTINEAKKSGKAFGDWKVVKEKKMTVPKDGMEKMEEVDKVEELNKPVDKIDKLLISPSVISALKTINSVITSPQEFAKFLDKFKDAVAKGEGESFLNRILSSSAFKRVDQNLDMAYGQPVKKEAKEDKEVVKEEGQIEEMITGAEADILNTIAALALGSGVGLGAYFRNLTKKAGEKEAELKGKSPEEIKQAGEKALQGLSGNLKSITGK